MAPVIFIKESNIGEFKTLSNSNTWGKEKKNLSRENLPEIGRHLSLSCKMCLVIIKTNLWRLRQGKKKSKKGTKQSSKLSLSIIIITPSAHKPHKKSGDRKRKFWTLSGSQDYFGGKKFLLKNIAKVKKKKKSFKCHNKYLRKYFVRKCCGYNISCVLVLQLSTSEVKLITQIQILNKAVCISFCAIPQAKVWTHLFSIQLWVK